MEEEGKTHEATVAEAQHFAAESTRRHTRRLSLSEEDSEGSWEMPPRPDAKSEEDEYCNITLPNTSSSMATRPQTPCCTVDAQQEAQEVVDTGAPDPPHDHNDAWWLACGLRLVTEDEE